MVIRAHALRRRQWDILLPRIGGRVVLYLLLIAFAVIFLYPFYDMFIGSFMQDHELFSRTPNLWPKRSEEHTSELQSLMRISYAVFCLKKKNTTKKTDTL